MNQDDNKNVEKLHRGNDHKNGNFAHVCVGAVQQDDHRKGAGICNEIKTLRTLRISNSDIMLSYKEEIKNQ